MGHNHVDPGRLHELRDLDLLDVAEVGDELKRQVAGGLAGAALAHGVPLDHPEPLVEVREHAQALVDELLAPERFALAIKQYRIAFDLGQREGSFVRGNDQLQQLGDDVGGVIDLGRARKSGETADVGDQNDRSFGHGEDSKAGRQITYPLQQFAQ